MGITDSAIKSLIPLFFAYNHYNYEEVATTDAMTFPNDVLKWFLRDGWTVSAKGRPHHNLALDEAHESMINICLKTITSRPSHFRTVEMSNFMSYLDMVVRGMEGQLYRHKECEPVPYRKRYTCQHAVKINEMLRDIHIFDQDKQEHHSLCNIVCPAKLEGSVRPSL